MQLKVSTIVYSYNGVQLSFFTLLFEYFTMGPSTKFPVTISYWITVALLLATRKAAKWRS